MKRQIAVRLDEDVERTHLGGNRRIVTLFRYHQD